MVLPIDGVRKPVTITDSSGNAVEIILGAINRLAVSAVGGGGVAPLNTVTFSAPTFVTVGAANTPIIAANAARKALILTVTTAGARVSLAFGGVAAVLDSGITIVTSQPLILDASMLSTEAIAGWASAAGVNVAIQEGV